MLRPWPPADRATDAAEHNRTRCADGSSPSKAARAPASRPRPALLAQRLQALGIGGRADARARRLAGRRDHPPRAACRAPPSRSGRRPKRSCSRRRATTTCATPSSRRSRAAHWVICDRFIEFDPRLSGRARPGRSQADSGARARDRRRPHARPDLRPRCAGRGRAGARAQAARRETRPTGSRPRRSTFHEKLRDAYRQSSLHRAGPLRADRRHTDQGRGRRTDLEGRERAARSGDRAGRARRRGARERAPTDDAEVPPSARDDRAVRPRRGRADACSTPIAAAACRMPG